ncbi:hypothetical protein TRFO_09478 [Tritrichomonas foetus]|uniref:VPS9 domain-containing protein n=1 Tax=Tritrichomonas foetus TaxID=1144522 RepID=A0A1J4JE34_9EUKA|nr:hypothetical protein TRFO_09478 [Tritrichomonas foetus]|eukprot:OHS97462.1 hypothetical protein TRFO_09478 [Tritrichomonas foetus]
MTILDFIIDSFQYRTFQLECEIDILEDQINFYRLLDDSYPKKENMLKLLFVKRSLLIDVRSVYVLYINGLKKVYSKVCPFGLAVQKHKFSIHDNFNEFKRLFEKISAHQMILKSKDFLWAFESSFQSFYNSDFIKNMVNIDDLMMCLDYFFPYREMYNILLNSPKFFPELLKIAIQYDPKNNTDSLKKVYKLLMKEKRPFLSEYNHYAIEAIAEVLLSILTYKSRIKSTDNPLQNFSLNQNCRMLVNNKFEQIDIKPTFIEIIEKNLSFNKNNFTTKKEENGKFMLPQIDKNTRIDQPLEYDDSNYNMNDNYDAESKYLCLQHIVLEMRKLATKPSVTFCYYILSNISKLLNEALSTEGKAVGMDESFQFFVVVLADARLYQLLSIFELMNRFIPPDFKASQMNFYLVRLNIAIDFIRSRRLINVPPYLLLPFKQCNEKLKGLELVKESETFDRESENSSIIEKEESIKEIIFHGFTVYAYPTYCDSQIPAIVHCTGNFNDSATLYQYQAISEINIECDYFTIPTEYGSLLYFMNDLNEIHYNDPNNEYSSSESSNYSDSLEFYKAKINNRNGRINKLNDLIKLGNNEKFDDLIDDIADMSNMMLMLPNVSNKLANLHQIKKDFYMKWSQFRSKTIENFDENQNMTFELVKYLKQKLFTPGKVNENGVIDKQTFDLLVSKYSTNDGFLLSSKLYSYIVSQ